MCEANAYLVDEGHQRLLICMRCFDVVFRLCVFPRFDDKVETLRFFDREMRNSGVLAVARTQGNCNFPK